MDKGGGVVVEVDNQDFFDALVPGHLRGFLDQRVCDAVIRRTIDEWLKAGVLGTDPASGLVRIAVAGLHRGRGRSRAEDVGEGVVADHAGPTWCIRRPMTRATSLSRSILGLVLCLALVLAACGDGGGNAGGADAASADADASSKPDAPISGSCTETGAGAVNGTVDGVSIEPVTAWYREGEGEFAGFSGIVLDERSAMCFEVPSGPGEALVFVFCDTPVTEGEYTLVVEQNFPQEPCPGQRIALAVVEDADGTDLAESVAGTVTISSATGCLDGIFSATFNDDGRSTVTGSFSAVLCSGR
jgi:hypothetical protein